MKARELDRRADRRRAQHGHPLGQAGERGFVRGGERNRDAQRTVEMIGRDDRHDASYSVFAQLSGLSLSSYLR